MELVYWKFFFSSRKMFRLLNNWYSMLLNNSTINLTFIPYSLVLIPVKILICHNPDYCLYHIWSPNPVGNIV